MTTYKLSPSCRQAILDQILDKHYIGYTHRAKKKDLGNWRCFKSAEAAQKWAGKPEWVQTLDQWESIVRQSD